MDEWIQVTDENMYQYGSAEIYNIPDTDGLNVKISTVSFHCSQV